MKLDGNKKIVLLGMCLIIIAGLIVIALKGLNVDMLYHAHETIYLNIGKPVDIRDMEDICKEVFNDKKVNVRLVELYDDSVAISFLSITDEEQNKLYTAINETYGTNFGMKGSELLNLQPEEGVENPEDLVPAENSKVGVDIQHIEKVRIRDMIRPYVIPTIVFAIFTVIYMVIRYWKLDKVKLLSNLVVLEILTIATIVGVIAIVRIPICPLTLNVIYILGILEMVAYLYNVEKDA